MIGDLDISSDLYAAQSKREWPDRDLRVESSKSQDENLRTFMANEKWILTGPSFKWLIFFLQNRLTISLSTHCKSHDWLQQIEITINH